MFKDEDDLSYIYHEKNGISSEALVQRIRQRFQTNDTSIDITPPDEEIKKSSGPTHGTIRIHSLIPFFSKKVSASE
jgi:hypothetical protein